MLAVIAGQSHVTAAAAAQGPGLLFAMAGNTMSQVAQFLFMTSLFAAALAFHNAVWRYIFALSREGVLPDVLSRTGAAGVSGGNTPVRRIRSQVSETSSPACAGPPLRPVPERSALPGRR